MVGEFYPPSADDTYILCMVDLCLHWVEALLLKYIADEDITDALMSVFYCTGFPYVILSDNGTK